MLINLDWITSKSLVPYPLAVDYMENLITQIIEQKAKPTIWLLEHPNLYTAGSSANPSELIKNTDFPVYKSARGGKYTYHGPGMRIVYCMLPIQGIMGERSIRNFVQKLEEWIISTLLELGIVAFTRDKRIGVWVNHNQQECKIAAIGLKIKKWYSYHGLAINLHPEIKHYSTIVPCGIKDYGVTSIEEMGVKCSLNQLNDILKEKFIKIFSDIAEINLNFKEVNTVPELLF